VTLRQQGAFSYRCPNGHVWANVTDDQMRVNIVCPSCQATAFRTDDESPSSALARLADLHHRTVKGSRKHDPENVEWDACECASCGIAQAALGIKRWQEPTRGVKGQIA
jgi:hypothetical protein